MNSGDDVATRVIAMAEAAVAAFGRDLAATTDLDEPPFEYRIEEFGIRISYWGQFATVPVMGTTQAEVTIEVADFFQEQVAEDSWSAWPVCPRHGFGLRARKVEDRAAWLCPSASGHVVGSIGDLGGPISARTDRGRRS